MPKPRKRNPDWKDTTRTARGNKRKAELQAAAELNGFETWSGMMTYIKNEAMKGRAAVKVKKATKKDIEVKTSNILRSQGVR